MRLNAQPGGGGGRMVFGDLGVQFVLGHAGNIWRTSGGRARRRRWARLRKWTS